MNHIAGIIDMDGFTISKKFYCRELGMFNIKKDVGVSIHFDIGIRWGDLTNKDKKTCSFLTKNIHKLPFAAPRGSRSLDEIRGVVKEFYETIKENNAYIIAYKGGHFEKDLLKELGIPAVNLEEYGCPKTERLFDGLVWLETCGHHTEAHAYQHCAKVEVEAFAKWVKDNL